MVNPHNMETMVGICVGSFRVYLFSYSWFTYVIYGTFLFFSHFFFSRNRYRCQYISVLPLCLVSEKMREGVGSEGETEAKGKEGGKG